MEKNEEILETEVEIIKKEDEPEVLKITKIRLSDEENTENPFGKLASNMEEIQKIKPYGMFALIISIIAIFWMPKILGTTAIFLATADIFFGSAFTKKLSLSALIIAILAILNAL